MFNVVRLLSSLLPFLLLSHWQIVQVVEDEGAPGWFRVWTFVDSGILQCVRVQGALWVLLALPTESVSHSIARQREVGRKNQQTVSVCALRVEGEVKW